MVGNKRAAAVVAIVGAMLGTASAQAQGITCKDLGQSASVILEGRLNGLSRATVLNIVANSSAGPAWQQAVSAAVDAAFAEPLPSSPAARLMAVRDFGALIERSCQSTNVGAVPTAPVAQPNSAPRLAVPEQPTELPKGTLFAEPFSSELGAGYQLCRVLRQIGPWARRHL